jgi:hypothetical protein
VEGRTQEFTTYSNCSRSVVDLVAIPTGMIER